MCRTMKLRFYCSNLKHWLFTNNLVTAEKGPVMLLKHSTKRYWLNKDFDLKSIIICHPPTPSRSEDVGKYQFEDVSLEDAHSKLWNGTIIIIRPLLVFSNYQQDLWNGTIIILRPLLVFSKYQQDWAVYLKSAYPIGFNKLEIRG